MLIAFDLDGTLVDSARDLADSTNGLLEAYGAARRADAELLAMVGEGARRLVERALAAARIEQPIDEALVRFREIYGRRLLRHTRPYAGIPELIQAIAGRAGLALVTNKPEHAARRLLDAFDLARHFSWVVAGDGPFPRKPAPDGLRHAMREAAATPAAALMVGDSAIDLETARRAGIRFCLAAYGFGRLRGGLELSPGDLRAADPHELRAVLEHLLGEESR